MTALLMMMVLQKNAGSRTGWSLYRRSWDKTLELYKVMDQCHCIKARFKKKDRPSDQESKDGKVW
jgi:hypothetical protein